MQDNNSNGQNNGNYAGLDQTQLTGLLIASGIPFGKALVASAGIEEQRQQQAMQQQKMQMEQQKMMQGQMERQRALQYIDSLGGQQPRPSGASTLAEANAQGMNNNESQLAAQVSPDILKQARILAQSGDTAGVIKLLNQKTPLQEELAKKDAQSLFDAQAVVEQAVPFRDTLDRVEKTLDKVPEALLGRVAGYTAPYFNSDAQVLESEANTITSLSRILLKFPASGFSDPDRKFLENASIGLFKDKKANKEVIARLRSLLDRSVRYTQALEKKAAKTGNLRGAATDFYNQEFNNNSSSQNNAPQANQGTTKRSIQDLSEEELRVIAGGK